MVAFVRKGMVLVVLSVFGLLVFVNLPRSAEFWTSLRERFFNSSRCACDKCMAEGDEWFMAHFEPNINPFLTRQSNISDQNYLWWKKLQGDPNDVTTFRHVVNQVFNIFSADQGFMDSGPRRCRSCSVVGNSGNLQSAHNGLLIDSSDVVFRMNGAPIKGYEKHVGKKTTFHIMYPESAVDLEDERIHLMLFPFKTLDLFWLISAFSTGSVKFTYQPVKPRIKANKELVTILNPEFMKYVYEVWLQNKGRYPSTGFLGLMLAMHICDEVNVFGYGADSNGNWEHYWEELKNKNLRTGVHSGTEEFKLIQQFAKKGIINFFPGY